MEREGGLSNLQKVNSLIKSKRMTQIEKLEAVQIKAAGMERKAQELDSKPILL